MNKLELIKIRDSVPEDRNFILATWLRGLRYGNEWYGQIVSDVYFKVQQAVIDNILGRPDTIVKIACLADDNDVILGYSVCIKNTLVWVFVKKAWRSVGIAKALVPTNITTVSNLTDVGRAILKTHPLRFNPFDLE
jgi:GNAT superfamily N-acetyltransferase